MTRGEEIAELTFVCLASVHDLVVCSKCRRDRATLAKKIDAALAEEREAANDPETRAEFAMKVREATRKALIAQVREWASKNANYGIAWHVDYNNLLAFLDTLEGKP